MDSNENGENRLDKRGNKIGKRSETSRLNGFLGGRPINLDYDSDRWYDYIYQLAAQSVKQEEMPAFLYQEFKVAIHPSDFSDMINGSYDEWTEEENERRSVRLRFAIRNAKHRQLSKIRNTYLTTALGGQPIVSKSTTKRKLRIDGQYTDDEEISTTTTESVTQPNMAALATWLYHYDDDWRRVQRGLVPKDDAAAEQEALAIQEEQGNTANGGVDIGAWIEEECKVNSKSEPLNLKTEDAGAESTEKE